MDAELSSRGADTRVDRRGAHVLSPPPRDELVAAAGREVIYDRGVTRVEYGSRRSSSCLCVSRSAPPPGLEHALDARIQIN